MPKIMQYPSLSECAILKTLFNECKAMTHEYQEDAPPQGQPIPMFFIGTKVIKAQPINRLEYNQLRGWTVPDDENPADDGYMVEYTDGGAPNHPDYDGVTQDPT